MSQLCQVENFKHCDSACQGDILAEAFIKAHCCVAVMAVAHLLVLNRLYERQSLQVVSKAAWRSAQQRTLWLVCLEALCVPTASVGDKPFSCHST